MLWSSSVCSFQEFNRLQRPDILLKSSYLDSIGGDGSANGNSSGDGNAGPVFPSSSTPQQSPQDESHQKGQANTRFSAFAPDLSLDASDFRSQLRENMKADLERRRNEDPNRGNQIAKNYLDGL